MTLQCAPLDRGGLRDDPSGARLVGPERQALVLWAESPEELREHLAAMVAAVDPSRRWFALICGRRLEVDYALAASGAGAVSNASRLHGGGTGGSLVELPASDRAVAGLVDALEVRRLRLSLLLADVGEDADRLRTLLLGGRHAEAVRRALLSVLAIGGEVSALVVSAGADGLLPGLPEPALAGVPPPPWVTAINASQSRSPRARALPVVAALGVVAVVALGSFALFSRHAGSGSAPSSAPAAVGPSPRGPAVRPSPGLMPPPREQAAAAWDPATGELVLTGGLGTCCGAEGRILDDTWRLGSAGWSLDGGRDPRPRWGGAMAYDSSKHDLVLWGGARGVGDDTWLWDGQAWSEARGTPAPVLCEPSMATNPATGDPWLVGSCATLPFPGVGVPLRTWRWHVDRWEDLAGNSDQPSVTGPHLVADPATGSMLVIGEEPGVHPSLTTWQWDGAVWRRLNPPSAPPASASYAVAADPADQLVILVADGGALWTWDGQTWAKQSAAGSGHPEHVAVAVTDGTTDLVVAGSLASTDTDELWTWRTDRGWMLVRQWSPSGR